MPASSLLAFDLSTWGPWVAPAVGVVFAVLVASVGYLVLGLRSSPPKALPSPVATPPSPTELAYDPFLDGAALERRYGPRRKGNAVSVFISNAEATAEPFPGWVIDRSVGGLRLAVDRSVAKNVILSVRTTNAPESIAWAQVEVKNCVQHGLNWELGCAFVRTPPWSVLLLFG
jgi:hypothetical protein